MNYLFAMFLSLVLFGAGCTVSPLPSPVALEPSATLGSASLDLSGRGLTAIPAEVFSRGDLERLDLSNNKLTGAPSSRSVQDLERIAAKLTATTIRR